MNKNATPEDRITAWLVSDAPPQAPDRLLEDTFEQTRRIRRRGSPLDWRIFSMMRSVAVLTTAAVAVVALAMISGGLLDRSPGLGGPPTSTGGTSPSPSVASASPGPTDTPQPSGPQAFEDIPGGGNFEPGTYTISSIAPLEISFTVPAGWERPPNAPDFLGPTGQDGREIGGLSFRTPTQVYANPCHVVDVPSDASVAEVVDALATLPGVETSSPENVTVSGFDGTYLKLTNPCGDHAEVRFWVLDVVGVRLVMVAHLWKEYAGSSEAVAELQDIVDSVQIKTVAATP